MRDGADKFIAALPVKDTLAHQRAYFMTGATKSLSFRLAQLEKLKELFIAAEADIFKALERDLRKSTFEAYGSEAGFIVSEIKHTIKKLSGWMKPKRVLVPMNIFPGTARIQSEPYGVSLIIGPWNYPFQLVVGPLIGAVAAGNCAIIKPSELAPHTSALLAKLINENFPKEYLAVIEGGVETTTELLRERFDYVFFTGGTAVGRVVMRAAAEHLTPVTLELGGKSPCIVDETVNLEVGSRRIVWGKFFNAGQTCTAPDYILVQRSFRDTLVEKLCQRVREFYGDDPRQSPDFPRIINAKHFDRVSKLLGSGRIAVGGITAADERFIAPTILVDVQPNDPVMQEEIFGPVLPVLTYDRIEEAIAFVNAREKPLALYIFSNDKTMQERILADTSSGGVCINDTLVHSSFPGLPFGGVGQSGIGAYHGKFSFDTFSHKRGILNKANALDISFRYAPYKDNLKILRRFI